MGQWKKIQRLNESKCKYLLGLNMGIYKYITHCAPNTKYMVSTSLWLS